MKRVLLSTVCLFATSALFAQQPAKHLAFAITSDGPGSYNYSEIKIVDLHSGAVIKPLFQKNQSYKIVGHLTGKMILSSDKVVAADSMKIPMATMVGAAAYDKVNNRLFYTPLGVNQLRYIDLNQSAPSFSYIDDQPFGTATGKLDIANQIPRMVIDANGNGYGLSNDGNHFVKFTTGSKVTITDLGPVVNSAKDSPNVAFHSSCTCASYGGDMVADASGNLYVVSAYNSIYKIDVKSQTASFVGKIAGLPDGFTSNGAAVDDDGELIVSCATSTAALVHPYFKVDMVTLKATKMETISPVLNTSDLATGNLLFQSAVAPDNKKAEIVTKLNAEVIENKQISIYPNPVKEGGTFRMAFNNIQKGTYEIQVIDMLGHLISKKAITISNKNQVEEVDIRSATSRGAYMVSLMSTQFLKVVFNNKIIIE